VKNAHKGRRPRTVGGASRRELLKLAPLGLLGAFLVPAWRKPLLERGLAFADRMGGATFRSGHLAPTFADSECLPFARFPYNYYLVKEPPLDLDAWRLEVSGAVSRPGAYDLDDLRRLPKVSQNTRLVCVEGWEAIGNFGGATMASFLEIAGADPAARFLELECADDYYQSIDMASARHPQSLLAYEMYDRPLDRGHGAPLRLAMPTKLGYKQAKYLTRLKVSHALGSRRGLWEDQGYSWYGGI
jgi:DMSO/TMAO reductase YedYZ molybdopterin-dependent catalytic subunit